MNSLWLWLKAFFSHKPQQTCWVYCPGCNLELTKSPQSFVSDDDRGVIYVCFSCRLESTWDFDAPTPLLMNTRQR